jgi:hypothetical protein
MRQGALLSPRRDGMTGKDGSLCQEATVAHGIVPAGSQSRQVVSQPFGYWKPKLGPRCHGCGDCNATATKGIRQSDEQGTVSLTREIAQGERHDLAVPWQTLP